MSGFGDIGSAVYSILGIGESVLNHLDDVPKNEARRLILVPGEGDKYTFVIQPEDALGPAGSGTYAVVETPGQLPIYQFMGRGEQRVAIHGLLKGADAYTDYLMFEEWKRWEMSRGWENRPA